MRFEFEIGPPDAGRRVDRFVRAALGQVPPSLVQRLLRQKKVRVNGERVSGDRRLEVGDEVVIHHVPRAPDASAGSPRVDRVFGGTAPTVLEQTDEFLFLAKPPNMACSDDGHDPGCLPLWLAHHFAGEIARGSIRPEPCHRLDRGTSGVVVVSLTAAAHERFRRAHEAGAIEKWYEVAVWGAPPAFRRCEIDLVRLEGVGPGEPRVVPADASVAPAHRWSARTDFERVARSENCALLSARLYTGRTHQIRAHCRALGHPVVADPRYGDEEWDRRHGTDRIGHPLLHSRRLVLDDEHGRLEATAPWLQDERIAVKGLGLPDLRDPRPSA